MRSGGKLRREGGGMRSAAMLWAAVLSLPVAAPALAEEPAGEPAAGGVYYEPPRNLCDELGGAPECPPDGAPVDPAKAASQDGKPEVIFEPPHENGAPAAGEEAKPEAYRELESDCEKAGWGGAPTCD